MTEHDDFADPDLAEEHPEQADGDAGADGGAGDNQPGHLGNDLSKMKLLETDLAEIATKDMHEDRDPIPGVQEALQKLNEMDVDIDKMD
ncbi:MAG: hypothetical protein Q4G46_11465 [Propionibacteriaceae bacterium]|nr:hypothetical protein [Propionibacteriaceae bacterium]